MKPVFRRRMCFVSLGLMLWVCTPPPPLERESIQSLFETLHSEKKITHETAFGTVRFAVNGEVHRGSIETVLKKNGEFQSDFYSPFGGVVASIRSDSAKGVVVFEDQEYVFALSQIMDSLPFSWGNSFTFGELVRILLGRLPSAYMEQLRARPDTLIEEKKTISALWKTDSTTMEVVIRRKSACIDKITIGAGAFMNRAGRVELASFRKSFAHKIEVYESDDNYFIIEYSKIKSN